MYIFSANAVAFPHQPPIPSILFHLYPLLGSFITMRFSLIPVFLLSLASSSVLASPRPQPEAAPAAAVEGASDLESRTFWCPTGTNWKITKCCPWDAYEFKFKCVCNDQSKSLSADGKKCENKCSTSGWKFCQTQCCPPGSDEKYGKCVVSLPSLLLRLRATS